MTLIGTKTKVQLTAGDWLKIACIVAAILGGLFALHRKQVTLEVNQRNLMHQMDRLMQKAIETP